MSGDAVDLATLEEMAARWEGAAVGFAAQAALWRARAGPSEVAVFAEHAAATLAAHAEVASAAAQRLRDYYAEVRSVDEEGSRSVRHAMAAAASMSTAPIREVAETPAPNA